MTRILRSFVFAVMTALVALAVGVPAAVAAPAVPWETVSLNLSTDMNAPLLMVSGKLPDGAPLPATIELALPTGADVQWAGEILGGDPSADPEAKPVKTTRGGQDIYTFTLTKARVAQIEALVSPVVTNVGGVYSVTFSQNAWIDAAEYVVAIPIPQAGQLSETPTGTAILADGPTGFRYYQRSFPKVKTGDPLAVTFSYTLPVGATTGTPAAGQSAGGGMLVPILLVLLALAVGAALVVGVRRKMNPIVEQPVARKTSAANTRKPATSVANDEEDGFVAQDAAPAKADDVEAAEAGPAAPRNKIAMYGALAIVAALLVGGIYAVSSGSAAKSTGDAITKVLSNGEACTQAKIPLVIPEDANPAQAAEQLFAALAPVPSITTATVRLSTSTIEIGYCDSETNEDAIRAALAPTGYVAAGAPAPSAPASTTP